MPCSCFGVLAGLTAGLATSAFAGAQRTDTAFERLHDEALGAHAIVFATQADIYDADWTEVVASPEVEAAGTFALAPLRMRRAGGEPVDSYVLPPSDELNIATERPVLSAGRQADPDRADEVWINEEAAHEYDLEVGDTVEMDSYLDLAASSGT